MRVFLALSSQLSVLSLDGSQFLNLVLLILRAES